MSSNHTTYNRILNPKELDVIADLSAVYNNHTFSYTPANITKYKQKLSEPYAFQLIARDNDQVIGYVAASELIFPDHLFIAELLVDQSAQGKGIGRTFVEKCISFARNEGLKGLYTETEAWNIPAQSLYEKCGFVKVDNPDYPDGPTYKYPF